MAKEYYQQLCDNAGVGLIATDRAFDITFWNSSAARIFGEPSQRMIGRSILTVVPEDRCAMARQLLRRATERKEVSEFEIRHVNPQGRPLYLAVTVSPVLNDANETVGASAFVRDITGRVGLERKLAKSQRLASLGTFASGIAHHFNNILGGIATTVDFALDARDPGALRRALNVTADAVTRASKLVEQLMSFAEGEQKDVDLADATETVCYFMDLMEEELKQANIEVEVQTREQSVFPIPFHSMLSILESLVANAREAMADEGGRLRILVSPQPGQLLLRLEDTGQGIREDDAEHVFEPFFSTKAGEDTSGDPRLGLGLAVVHGIVTDLQGTIDLRSESGKGTTVEIIIPRSTDPL